MKQIKNKLRKSSKVGPCKISQDSASVDSKVRPDENSQDSDIVGSKISPYKISQDSDIRSDKSLLKKNPKTQGDSGVDEQTPFYELKKFYSPETEVQITSQNQNRIMNGSQTKANQILKQAQEVGLELDIDSIRTISTEKEVVKTLDSQEQSSTNKTPTSLPSRTENQTQIQETPVINTHKGDNKIPKNRKKKKAIDKNETSTDKTPKLPPRIPNPKPIEPTKYFITANGELKPIKTYYNEFDSNKNETTDNTKNKPRLSSNIEKGKQTAKSKVDTSNIIFNKYSSISDKSGIATTLNESRVKIVRSGSATNPIAKELLGEYVYLEDKKGKDNKLTSR